MLNLCSGVTPYESPNSPPTQPLAFYYWTVSKPGCSAAPSHKLASVLMSQNAVSGPRAYKSGMPTSISCVFLSDFRPIGRNVSDGLAGQRRRGSISAPMHVALVVSVYSNGHNDHEIGW